MLLKNINASFDKSQIVDAFSYTYHKSLKKNQTS